jgi:DNA-binding response OmpR family regulator
MKTGKRAERREPQAYDRIGSESPLTKLNQYQRASALAFRASVCYVKQGLFRQFGPESRRMDGLGSFEGFRLDRRGLFRLDQVGMAAPVPISPRALDLLALLVQHNGELVPKNAIMRASGRASSSGKAT